MELIERDALKDITVMESPIFGLLMKFENGRADIEETTKAIIDSVEEDIRAEISKAPTVDAVPVIRCKDCMHRYNEICECWNLEKVELNGFCERARREDEQPSSDACDQISELVMERLKAEKILEQLGQNLGEVFGKIAETIDDYCNEYLKEKGKEE